jgi:hypothetical protein
MAIVLGPCAVRMKGVGFPSKDTIVGASRGVLVASEVGITGHVTEALASALA